MELQDSYLFLCHFSVKICQIIYRFYYLGICMYEWTWLANLRSCLTGKVWRLVIELLQMHLQYYYKPYCCCFSITHCLVHVFKQIPQKKHSFCGRRVFIDSFFILPIPASLRALLCSTLDLHGYPSSHYCAGTMAATLLRAKMLFWFTNLREMLCSISRLQYEHPWKI